MPRYRIDYTWKGEQKYATGSREQCERYERILAVFGVKVYWTAIV